MHFRLKTFIVLGFVLVNSLSSQTTFPSNGAPNPVHTIYAFTNAVIHVDYETTIANGLLVFQDGKIIVAAEKAVIPQGALVIASFNDNQVVGLRVSRLSDINLGSDRSALPRNRNILFTKDRRSLQDQLCTKGYVTGLSRILNNGLVIQWPLLSLDMRSVRI